MSRKIRSGQAGFSMIELLLVVMAIGFLALLIANLPSSLSSINKSRHTSIATQIANRQIEILRKTDFSALSNRNDPFYDSELASLPNGSGQILIEDCPSSICATVITNTPKKAEVSVTWLESGDNKSVKLTTVISLGGLGQ